MLEDSATDAELMRYALRTGGLAFSWEHVDNEADFVRQLEARAPHLILSDFSMPSFDGYKALEIAREKHPEVPFIFVTGTLGEEVAN